MSDYSEFMNVAEQKNKPAVTLSYLLVTTDWYGQGAQDATVRLYANNKQTSKVEITLVARDEDGQVVTLPANTRIDIIPYTAFSRPDDWAFSSAPSDYTNFDETLPGLFDDEDSSAEPVGVKSPVKGEVKSQTFYRYIRNVKATNNTTDRFAVRVTLGTTEFRTNHPTVEYGGTGANGQFNSSFRIRSVAPLRYTQSAGLIVSSPAEEVYNAVEDGFTAKIFNYYVSLQHPLNRQPVRFHQSSAIVADSSLNGNKATALGEPRGGVHKKNIPGSPVRLGNALNAVLNRHPVQTGESVTVAVAMWARVTERFATRQTSYCRGMVDMYGNSFTLRINLVSTALDEGRDPWKYTISFEGE